MFFINNLKNLSKDKDISNFLSQYNFAANKAHAVCMVVPSLNNDGAILAVMKNNNSIGFPAGKIEFNENPVNAAVRETFEETGIFVDVNHCIPIYCCFSDTKTITFTYYCNKIIGGTLHQTTREGTPLWINPHMLITNNCEYKNYNLNIIQVLIETKLL